jgi:hypothetical protein
LATRPESLGTYPDFHGDVEFVYDEVISEGSTPSQGFGTGDLEKLVLLSPTRDIPRVRWHRETIGVRPQEGWKPNRIYRVEVLPGISDLRRNHDSTGIVLTFSTGAPLPTDTLKGTVVDWVGNRLARGAMVELALAPDSLVYRTLTDSSGRFTIGPLPRGDYLVTAFLDQNKNLRLDRREAFDTVRQVAGKPEVPPLWTVPHDTVGPRIQAISPADSVSAVVTFTEPIDPTQPIDSVVAHLFLLPDSTSVSIRSLRSKPAEDSLQAQARAAADSARARQDTTRHDTTRVALPTPRPPRAGVRRQPAADTAFEHALLRQRPQLFDKLVLHPDSAFTPGAKYVLEVLGIRNIDRVPADSRQGFEIPKPPPPKPSVDTTAAAAAADSAKKAGVPAPKP